MLSPYSDVLTRPGALAFSASGVIARLPMSMVGIGIVLMTGLVRGGYRYIDELERSEGEVPLLGTVPDLKTADSEHESMAALSIHHLRNLLQLQFERS